jgi:hypothetical protein
MDDRWFIFFEDDWLYFHRSWTGACIYALRFAPAPNGVGVVESWVSRDPDQYNSPGIEEDRRIVRQLIQTRLLAAEP